MAMVISARSKVVTVVSVTLFGLALMLIIGSVIGWFDRDTQDFSRPLYSDHQRLAFSNYTKVGFHMSTTTIAHRGCFITSM